MARWDHTHLVEPDGPDACWLTDRIEYELPLATVALLARPLVEATLKRTFDYRHRTISGDLAMHRNGHGAKSMNILISGAGGMIGSAWLRR